MNELFEFPKYKITNRIRLIELFGGIGSQAMALRDIGADFEHYRLVEFDKYAVASYNSIHGTDFKVTDIRDVHGSDLGITEKDKYTYLVTYSFPCQSLSVAGKQAGMSRKDWEEGKSTRSGLLWEVERILKELPKENLPQVLLMENVTQVHAKKFIQDFNLWCDFLKSLGYKNFIKDLNGKDYGIPQSRNRCFMVSILSDGFVDYEFPKPQELKTVMKDYLEKSVDEKYYIKSEKADKLIKELIESGVLPTENRERYAPSTYVSRDLGKSRSQTVSPQEQTGESVICKKKVAECVRPLGFINKGTGKHQSNMVYDKNGLCPTEYADLYKEPFKVVEKWQK